jgi:hypothetical protein
MSPSDPHRAELRDTLARLILRHDLTLTSAEVTEKGGVDHARGLRLWRALGFPETGDGLAYGEPDVKALASVAHTLDVGLREFVTQEHLENFPKIRIILGDEDAHRFQAIVSGFAERTPEELDAARPLRGILDQGREQDVIESRG